VVGISPPCTNKEVSMPKNKIKAFLKENKVKFKVIEHSEVYTAQEIAASAHVPGKQLAKSVMVKIDGEMAMAVLPASYRVDFKQLKKAVGAKKVELASEGEFKDMFPDCEVGAMPPFGNLYNMDVIVAESLSEEMVIAFCGGTHTELIQVSFQDFERLAKPKVVSFSIKG
jgi:Ala-tRNA(Pro) deacylase